MFQFQEITIDKEEVESKLKGTELKMKSVSKQIMTAVNKEVVKTAKSNAKNIFNHFNTNPDETRFKPLLKSFQYKNDKYKEYVSVVKNTNFHSRFLEYGAHSKANEGKYLTFKIDGEWKKVKETNINPKPFLITAVKQVWDSKQAQTIADNKLQQILNKYWEK